jgi:hypothetical protein
MATEMLLKKQKSRRGWRWTPDKWLWLAGIVALLIGSIGLVDRFLHGLRPTDLGSFVPWGLWVAAYEYFVWLEVGSLFMFTLLVYVFKWKSLLPGMARMLYLTAAAILGMALILIGLDLGHPFRVWHVMVYPQWASLMTWMIWLHMVYMAVLVGKLFIELRPSPPVNGSAAGSPTPACPWASDWWSYRRQRLWRHHRPADLAKQRPPPLLLPVGIGGRYGAAHRPIHLVLARQA